MDDIVKQAMHKWPHVPACCGWLGLDARGCWWLRDARAQAAGSFSSGAPGAKGARVEHARLAGFIARNYLPDARGCWYFQNGPQQVFVELEAAPLIWRVRMADGQARIASHCDNALPAVGVRRTLVDEKGAVYLLADAASGPVLGLVHTQDMLDLAGLLEADLLPTPQTARRAALPADYGFVISPQALATLSKR